MAAASRLFQVKMQSETKILIKHSQLRPAFTAYELILFDGKVSL